MPAAASQPLLKFILSMALFITVLHIINTASAVTAHGVIIDSIEIKKNVDNAVTTLHLRVPIRYLGHFPESEGRVLKVRFQPTLRKSFTNLTEESVSPALNECSVIREISLDHGFGDDYFLTYRFTHSLHYTVDRQSNSQELVVILHNAHIDEVGDPCDAH